MYDQEGDGDGLGCARGLMVAVPVGILMWIAVIGAVMLIRSCHDEPVAQFRSAQAVEVHVT